MNEPADSAAADAHRIGRQHPLLADPQRMQDVTKAMHRAIQRTLRVRANDQDKERGLPGGESAEDVLQQAVLELLEHESPESFEALGITIARRRAVDALRRATRGRRRRGAPDEEPDRITVRPIDEVLTEYLGTPAGAWWDDPEQAYVHHAQQAVLHPLIRALPAQQRNIVVGVVFQGRPRAKVGRDLGLSGQRVGQILTQTVLSLLEEARRNPNFPSQTVERKQP